MSTRRKVLVGATVAVAGLVVALAAGAWNNDGDRTGQVLWSLNGGRAKNVIMFLGDGMGDSEITVAATTSRAPTGACRWTCCR